MSRDSSLGRRSLVVWSCVLALAIQSCSGGGDGNNGPTPSISISINPTSASVAQGGSVQVTATITATGSVSGTPSFTVSGVPTGVSGTVSGAQTNGNITTATVTIAVGASVTPGNYTITVNGTGGGVAGVSVSFALTVTAAATPAISLAANPATANVTQGGTAAMSAITITRSGGFTGSVALAVTGATAGLTATLDQANVSGNTATLTISASATATPGSATLTITGTGTGVTAQTTTVSVTVAVAGNYTLSAAPAALTITQGGPAATSTINVNRTGGFAGTVALAVTGASTGMTATLNPTSVPGNSSTLTVSALGTTATGTVTLTITGTTAGLANQTTTVSVTVNPASGGSGNVTLDWSACSTNQKPVWVAGQDGTGGWTRVTGTGDVYRFNVTSGKGGWAAALPGTTQGFNVTVTFATQAELTAAPFTFCAGVTLSGRTVTGSVAGVTGNNTASIAMGGATAGVAAGTPSFALSNVAPGPQDVFAYMSNLAAGPAQTDRAIILRNQDPAPGGSIGTLDFAGANAIAPVSAAITVTGAQTGEVLTASMSYLTGASCRAGTMYFQTAQPNTGFTAFGIPSASQLATDFHQLLIATGNAGASRSLISVFHTMAAHAEALGVPLPAPSVTVLSGVPYKRLQATLTLPTDYQTSMILSYSAGTRGATVTATFGYLGSASATVAFPDLTGASGFDPTWAPASNAVVNYSVFGTGASTGAGAITTFCAEGVKLRTASSSGTI